MNTNNFFSGAKEAVARIVSAIISISIFAVYTLGSQSIEDLDWLGVIAYLGVFWLLYEILAFMFFLLFRFFEGSKQEDISTTSSYTSQNSSLQEDSNKEPNIDL